MFFAAQISLLLQFQNLQGLEVDHTAGKPIFIPTRALDGADVGAGNAKTC
jgi:hypothetical protein